MTSCPSSCSDRDALLDQRLEATGPVGPPSSLPDDSGTNIGAAVELGRMILRGSADPRIVLVTDGHDSAGDTMTEAVAAAADGIPIDVIDPGDLLEPSRETIVLERVDAPRQVQLSEPFSLDVWVFRISRHDGARWSWIAAGSVSPDKASRSSSTEPTA